MKTTSANNKSEVDNLQVADWVKKNLGQGGTGITVPWTETPYTGDKWDNNYYTPSVCKNCPSHPSNGGSGICNCAAPQMAGEGITWKANVSSTSINSPVRAGTTAMNAIPVFSSSDRLQKLTEICSSLEDRTS